MSGFKNTNLTYRNRVPSISKRNNQNSKLTSKNDLLCRHLDLKIDGKDASKLIKMVVINTLRKQYVQSLVLFNSNMTVEEIPREMKIASIEYSRLLKKAGVK